MPIETVDDQHVEQRVLQSLSLDDVRALLDRFTDLVRESGSRDEWTAARYIAGRLRAWGIPHTLHEPELFLSIPKSASLEVRAPAQRTVRAKTPAFSASTGRKTVRGRVVYVPTGYAADADMVVMGLQRREKRRAGLGALSLAIARETDVPLVLICRRPTRSLGFPAGRFRRLKERSDPLS